MKEAWGLTFSKLWVSRIMRYSFFVLFWVLGIITISYKLHLSDVAIQCATDIAKLTLTEIIVVFSGYFLKAIFETKWEKEHELKVKSNEDNGDGM